MAPATLAAAWWLKRVRIRFHDAPVSRLILRKVGLLPVRNHYFEPYVDETVFMGVYGSLRRLPGVDMNEERQLVELGEMNYQVELEVLPMDKPESGSKFYYNNTSFGYGDSEYLYCMVRKHKPAKMIEVGSGMSTLMALEAVASNSKDDQTYACQITCIEPYECAWLETVGVNVIRNTVEEVDYRLFSTLRENDILFIDSSHVVMPGGDTLCEILSILPSLKAGVIVHFHDIFTPADYPLEWIIERRYLWTEQYMLEAFLTMNKDYEIIAALNYLKRKHPEQLAEKLPILGGDMDFRNPGSIWIRKIR